MSSGTPFDSGGRELANNVPIPERGSGWALSPRQMELDRYWRYYRCTNYDNRTVDWNGRPVIGANELEAVVSSTAIPPGFMDFGAEYPLKFRKPTVPYYLARVVINRFTGLLFSQRRHPHITVSDDSVTEEWLQQFAKETRLWARMISCRTIGGAMGSVGLSFKFVRGKPKVEVHDPRWCIPEFSDPEELDLRRLEIRYAYPLEIRDPESGKWVEQWYWYRRILDSEKDRVWPKVPMEDDGEPDWDRSSHKEYVHGFGFCPAVWIQNIPVQSDPNGDGDPDCYGVYDLIEAIDALYSQADKGVKSNCDPTIHIASDAEWPEVRKGSDNAMQTEAGGSISYVEITGSGPQSARELAAIFKQNALEVCRCVLDDTGIGQQRTATEIDRRYSGMLEQADILREQYGEAVKKLLELVLQAVRHMDAPAISKVPGKPPQIERRVVMLRPKVIEGEDGNKYKVPRKIGVGDLVELQWPEYFEPTLDDITKGVSAAGAAKQFTLIDRKKATEFVAKYFNIEDVDAVLKELDEMDERAKAQLEGQVMGQLLSSQ